MTKTKLEQALEQIWMDLLSGEVPKDIQEFKNKYMKKSKRKKLPEEYQCQCLTSSNKRCIKKIYKEALEHGHYSCYQHWTLFQKNKKYIYGTYFDEKIKKIIID